MSTDATPCGGCGLRGRRDFLRDAGRLAAGALVALGASPADARAYPIELVRALNRGDETKAYPMPPQDGVQIDKANGTMVARWQGKIYVYSLACPHQNTALKWSDADHQFECPKHHSRFTPDGSYIPDSGRATRGLDRFAVRRDGGNVVADLDKLYQQDEDAAAWASAFVTL